MSQTPDFLDKATEDWEMIQRQEANDHEEKPPTLPAKDAVYKLETPIIPSPVQQLQRSTASPEDETERWDLLDSQFISNPNDDNNVTANDHQAQTYDDADYDDDLYGEEYTVVPAMGESSTAGLPPVHTTDFTPGILGPDTMRMDPWAAEEAERQRREDEEAARKQQEEDDALKRKQEGEDAAEARRLKEEEERLKAKKAREKAERLKKEAEDDVLRKKKREEQRLKVKKAQEKAERFKEAEDDAIRKKNREEDEAAERITNPDSDKEMIKQGEKILRMMRRQAETTH